MKFKQMAMVTKDFIKSHKCEIATGAGIVLELVTVGLAIDATVKSKTVADETKKRLDDMWARVEALDPGEEREKAQAEMEKTEKKEIRKCGRKVARYYIWTGVALVGSIFCFAVGIKSHRAQVKGLSAALAAQIALNRAQQERAKKILSEEDYNRVFYGIQKSGDTIEDSKGNEVELYEFCDPNNNENSSVVGPQKIAASPNALYLTKEDCIAEDGKGWWTPSVDFNIAQVQQIFDWVSEVVRTDGVCKNNEIRTAFNLRPDDEYENKAVLFHEEYGKDQAHPEIHVIKDETSEEGYALLVDFRCENCEGKIADAVSRVRAWRSAGGYKSSELY